MHFSILKIIEKLTLGVYSDFITNYRRIAEAAPSDSAWNYINIFNIGYLVRIFLLYLGIFFNKKITEKEEYFCEKDDCKVNFDFRSSFSEDFKQKDFVCEFFSSGSLIEENCKSREITTSVLSVTMPGDAYIPFPMEVLVGGATIFVLDVVDFVRM